MIGLRVQVQGRIATAIIDAAGMQAVGDVVERLIRLRIRRGRDARGRTFKNYSDSYREQGGADTPLPDLKRTGAMLGALKVRDVTDHQAVVGVRGIRYAAFVNKRRRFATVAKDEIRAVQQIAAEQVARVLDLGSA